MKPIFLKYVKTSIAVVISIVATVIIVTIYNRVTVPESHKSGNALSPQAIIETFEISSLDYEYSNIIFEENTKERKLLFFKLEDAVQMYAVRYDGSIKMGVNGKEVKVEEQGVGKDKTLIVTIPKAYILSHEAPLADRIEVIYDFAKHSETAQIGQYIDLFNTYKKDTETKIQQDGLLLKAQESARKQLESLMNALPDIRDNYSLTFVLE